MHNDETIARSPTLTQSVAERISAAILDGRFEPGERLVETKLSTMFGVSRAPVREALKILETSGLVRIVVGRGTFVVRLEREALGRVVVAHGLLMGFVARLACIHGTARDLAALARAQRHVERAADLGKVEDLRQHEDVFLAALFDACDDSVLRHTALGMRDQILVHRRDHGGGMAACARRAQTTAGCLAALTAGDPDSAEARVRALTIRAGFALIDQPLPPAVDIYLAGESVPLPAQPVPA
ncbi:GntR family transcriptional regulator [Caenispirillum bisanense]|uniref:DNA-binding transcriptional regulator, GntR family n=1 Tax=Caenispirillum bisanense TaxID=414052 RepID=A0A286GJD7_9PROT|nr:GntR family transcriptional regulator [Caenispirillum bisanense]SOD95647.1 DNA-binding transcriptional regulator, GntR family [Caenispirillum bisanense]